MEQRQSFQEIVLKPDSHMPKNPKKTVYTLHSHKNSLKKFITDLNVKPESVNKTQKDIYMTLGMARTF